MIRLYTDASFIVRSKQAQIGLAVVVRDDARIVSRIQQGYTDPAITDTKSLSGENNNIAELRACLLGFEHLASLKAQGWVWGCSRVDYTTDSSWVVHMLNQAMAGSTATHGETHAVLGLIQAAWARAGVTEVTVSRKSERLCQNIRDCDHRSKRARNELVAPDEPKPKAKPKPKVIPKPPSRKNKKKKWRYD